MKDRTFNFALNVRKYVRLADRDFLNKDDISQVIRASGSVGSNFIEAIESVNRKDFIYRIRICKKEARESRFWLELMANNNQLSDGGVLEYLINEATEIVKIFSSIIYKHTDKS